MPSVLLQGSVTAGGVARRPATPQYLPIEPNDRNDVTITPGTIVCPASPSEDEVIVGITIHSPCDLPPTTTLVVWLSDCRGAFSCQEQDSDLSRERLTWRAGNSDPSIDHEALALLLGDQIADLSGS